MGLATLIFWLGRPDYDRVPSAGDPPSHFLKSGGVTLLAVGVLFGLGWGCGKLNLSGWITALAYVAVVLATLIPATMALHRRIEANRTPQAAGAFTVAWYLITKRLAGKGGADFYDAGRPYLTAETLEDTKALLRVLKVLSLIPFFWALWDQTSSTWVTQGTLMEPWVLSLAGEKFVFGAEQMQSMNALLVMILVPVFTLGVYPQFDRIGWKATPLRRMKVGLVITAVSFVIVGVMQQRIDALAAHGAKLSVLWQTVPYIVLTAGEVLVSATGNEFAYTHAPKTMKSTMTSIWLLTISVGNLLVALFTWLARRFSPPTETASGSHAASAGQFFRYALLTFAVSVVFVFVVSRFRGKNYSESDSETLEPLVA
jgi:proton-dependent oligopeptide transporter, POT family